MLVTVIRPREPWWRFGLMECWTYRQLVGILTWRDVIVRYKQAALGIAWVVIQPVLTTLVFSFFLGHLAKVPSDGAPYFLFVLCGLLPWSLLMRALNDAGTSLASNERMISKAYFPRIIVPTAVVLAGILDFVITGLVVACLLPLNGIHATASMVYLPIFLFETIALALALAWWLSALDATFRDVRYTFPFLTQLWLFTSPIAYPSSLVPEDWRWLYGLNPLAGLAEGYRWTLLNAAAPPVGLLLISSAVIIVLFLSGLFFFQRAQRAFADKL